MPDKKFAKPNRLRKSSEFRNVFNKGKKIVTTTLVFHVLRTDLPTSRLGLAVSRRVGNAVIRNGVKRRIREVFREKKLQFSSSYDLVVYPRKGIRDKKIGDFLDSFNKLLSLLKKKSI